MVYHLFISHSWTYGEYYDGLLRLLNSHPTFLYSNYSIPKDNPIHNTTNDTQLRAAIQAKMQHASCVVILAGVYATYSKWIKIEIELAKEMNKRIIAVAPWGAEHTSAVVKQAAHQVVRWNTASIVNAIRGY